MIWCVEDDSSIRDIEVYALTSTGFEAIGFEDGDSFWNALQKSRPELVILDVMLPATSTSLVAFQRSFPRSKIATTVSLFIWTIFPLRRARSNTSISRR